MGSSLPRHGARVRTRHKDKNKKNKKKKPRADYKLAQKKKIEQEELYDA